MSWQREHHRAGVCLPGLAALAAVVLVAGSAGAVAVDAPRTVATFSIVAADTAAGEWGVAVASRFLAAGSVVPWARAGVGAVATQAAANTAFGPHGLALMERGHSASEALAMLVRSDPRPEQRQVALVDSRGRVAVHTGDGCRKWAGEVRGVNFAVVGNSVAGPEVVDLMAKAFMESKGSLAERLLDALSAGDDAGGDAGGIQSAALLVVKAGGGYLGGNDRLVDLRVDDAKKPVTQLARLYAVHAARNLPAVHIRLGDQALAAGDRPAAEREYARVIHLYRQAMTRWPKDAALRNGLAWFYVRRRVNLDEAFRLAQEARELDPRSWEVVDTIAQIYYVRGNLAKARDAAAEALKLNPGNTYLAAQVERFETAIQEEGMR